jgi:hypothetical protein
VSKFMSCITWIGSSEAASCPNDAKVDTGVVYLQSVSKGSRK